MSRLSNISVEAETSANKSRIIVAMCDGNPGAMNVMISVFAEAQKIDPEEPAEGFAVMVWLDQLGIYGSDIWVLYKDVCGSDVTNVLAMRHAVSLGFVTAAELCARIRDESGRWKTNAAFTLPLLEKVKKAIPGFGSNL